MGSFFSKKVAGLDEYTSHVSEEDMAKYVSNSMTLRVFSEDLEWACVKLKPRPEPFTIGRRPASDILLSNKTTSGNHGELLYCDEEKCWKYKDVGSSSGSAFLDGPSITELATDQYVKLSVSCALRLGKCLLTFVSDAMTENMVLECTKGPMLGQVWKVPKGSMLLTCGKSKSNTISVESIKGLASVEFQLFHYNGWFAVSDVSGRESKEGKRNRSGVYLNGKQIRKKEMNFLWMGVKLQLGIERKTSEVDFVLGFEIKCLLQNNPKPN